MYSKFITSLQNSLKVQADTTNRGIAVGTKEDHQDLCNLLGETKVKLSPIIDKVFEFENSSEAFKYLYSGAHVGKVVIKI
jgi:threonine dehydrogenase-like Zn-dependent dehydrogenase